MKIPQVRIQFYLSYIYFLILTNNKRMQICMTINMPLKNTFIIIAYADEGNTTANVVLLKLYNSTIALLLYCSI